jgi:hypothetical protein
MARDAGDGPFEAIDPKLTIHALANGMDLAKESRLRRLGWYRDGREREVRIGVLDGHGGFTVAASAYRTGRETEREEVVLATVDTAQELVERLPALLEEARARADEL